MNQKDIHSLKRIKSLIWAAIFILIVAEVGWFLENTISYMIGLLIAIALFSVHWFTRHRTRLSSWEKSLSMALPVISILGPIIYILLQLFVFQGSGFKFQTLLVVCFIMPLGLLFYANHLVNNILHNTHVD